VTAPESGEHVGTTVAVNKQTNDDKRCESRKFEGECGPTTSGLVARISQQDDFQATRQRCATVNLHYLHAHQIATRAEQHSITLSARSRRAVSAPAPLCYPAVGDEPSGDGTLQHRR